MGDVVEWRSFAEPLQCKVNGVTYDLEAPDYPTVLDLMVIQEAGKNWTYAELHERIFGRELHERLKADRVPDEAVQFLSQVVFTLATQGREAAEKVLRGVPGEAPARRSATGSRGGATKPTTRTGAASTTRSRASGTGTRSPRKAAQPVKASAGHG